MTSSWHTGLGGSTVESDPVASAALVTHEADNSAHGLDLKQDVSTWSGAPGTNFGSAVGTIALDPTQIQQRTGILNLDCTFTVANPAQGAELIIEGQQGATPRSVIIYDGTNTTTIPPGTSGLPNTANAFFTMRIKWLDASTVRVECSGTGVPTHASTHAAGGSDAVTISKSQMADMTSLTLGDGSDSALSFDGTTTIAGLVPAAGVYTLTRDLWATNITNLTGSTLKTAGYKIYCTGNFVNNSGGILNFDGNSASVAVAGAATAKTVVSLAGATGVAGNGAVGTVGMLGGNSGGGGAGGTGTSSAGAVLVGSMTAAAVQQALKNPAVGHTGLVGLANTTSSLRGGASGSSGGGDGTNPGGGGGAGGGIIVVFCSNFTNAGTISCVGGAGGNVATGNAGGGGGGGGGGLLVYYRFAYSNTGTNTFTGGAAGTKAGTGANGSAGSAGLALAVAIG